MLQAESETAAGEEREAASGGGEGVAEVNCSPFELREAKNPCASRPRRGNIAVGRKGLWAGEPTYDAITCIMEACGAAGGPGA